MRQIDRAIRQSGSCGRKCRWPRRRRKLRAKLPIPARGGDALSIRERYGSSAYRCMGFRVNHCALDDVDRQGARRGEEQRKQQLRPPEVMNCPALDGNIDKLPFVMEGPRRSKANPIALAVSADHTVDLIGATAQ